MPVDLHSQTNLLMEKKQRINTCVECGSNDLILDVEQGELVCKHCGYVNSSTLLDYGPEWRAFDAEQIQKRTRVGAPLNLALHDKGLSTIIGWRGPDAYGKRLNSKQRQRAYRLTKWHRRSRVSDGSQRNLIRALSEISKYAYKLHLPKNVIDTASMLYRQVIRNRLIRGRSINGIAAASIYMSCRKCGILRTLKEVANATHISKKECARSYRFLLSKLRTHVPPANPGRYISKFINKLSLSGETESLATKILEKAAELKLTNGRGPSGMAAACTYIATVLTDERRTQGEIATEGQVTEVTLRNRYKELIQEIDIKVKL